MKKLVIFMGLLTPFYVQANEMCNMINQYAEFVISARISNPESYESMKQTLEEFKPELRKNDTYGDFAVKFADYTLESAFQQQIDRQNNTGIIAQFLKNNNQECLSQSEKVKNEKLAILYARKKELEGARNSSKGGVRSLSQPQALSDGFLHIVYCNNGEQTSFVTLKDVISWTNPRTGYRESAFTSGSRGESTSSVARKICQ